MKRRRKQLRLTQNERETIRRALIWYMLNSAIPFGRAAGAEAQECQNVVRKIDASMLPEYPEKKSKKKP